MYRYAMNELKEWKQSENRKPLILKGARQVGKTWLMKEFGNECFENVAYINFENVERLKNVFELDFEISRLLLALEIESGVKIEPEKTLIIFDEIQECPRALTSLKYFYENASEYCIIAAGSLLGVALHQGTSFPVGKVDSICLYPLSFEEFLEAGGNEKLIDVLKSDDHEFIASFKNKYIELLKIYYFIGGMPEVVKTFIDTNSYDEARRCQKRILNDYRADFSKHAPTMVIPRINQVWDSIPMQLAKENKKFIYGQIREGARAKDFEFAIQWLIDCGLIHKVNRVNKPGLPLKSYIDLNAFKLFLNDIGLLIAMTDLSEKVIIGGNSIFTEFKGALTEQYVLQQFVTNGLNPYYYSTANSSGEIDFLLQGETTIVPVEVKAEENLQARSLRAFNEKYNPEKSVRLSMSDFRDQDWLVNVPLYNIVKIKDYLK